jgi:hypothetical protein
MTAAVVGLTSVATTVNFTPCRPRPTFGTDAQKTVVGTTVLWAGDVNFNSQVKYTGSLNDRDLILTAIGGTIPTTVVTGQYRKEDLNMNAEVKYNGHAERSRHHPGEHRRDDPHLRAQRTASLIGRVRTDDGKGQRPYHQPVFKRLLYYLDPRTLFGRSNSNVNLRFMHGINRISIFLFVFCIILMVVKACKLSRKIESRKR